MDETTKVTKKKRIDDLFKQGNKAQEIREITGFSLRYIYNIISDINNPGILAKRERKYLGSLRGIETKRKSTKKWRKSNIESVRKSRRKSNKNWKKNHKDTWAKLMKLNKIRHAVATRPHATNHRQEWTMREIEFLQTHGQSKTVRQIALDLGRTHNAINCAAYKHKIDMRGDKTTTPSSRVSIPQSPTGSLPVSTI